MAFSRAGDRHAAAEQFDVIGDLATQWPWEYLDQDPGRRFSAMRHDAYANRGWSNPRTS
jgi:hypothetical protein